MDVRWRVLVALTFARVSMGFQFQSLASVSPFLSAELGLDKAQIGTLVGLYLMPGVFLALPAGALAGRFGEKRIVLAGLAMMALGGACLAVAGLYWQAVVARVIAGAGAVLLNVVLTKAVMDWFAGRETVLAMATLMNAWPVGIALALFSLGPLAQSTAWATAIWATVVFALVGMAWTFLVYRPAPGSTAAASAGFGAFTPRDWELLVLASIPWMLYNAVLVISVAFIPLHLLRAGESLVTSGSTMALSTLLTIGAVQAGGYIGQRMASPRLLIHASLALYALLLVAGLQSAAPIPWFVLAGLGGLPAGAIVAMPSAVLPAAGRAAGMGVFYVIFYAGTAVLPPIAGLAFDTSGSSAAPIWLAIALVIATMLAEQVFRWRRTS